MLLNIRCQVCDAELHAWSGIEQSNSACNIYIQPCWRCTRVAREQGIAEAVANSTQQPKYAMPTKRMEKDL
jgi:hypothetical protein